MSTTTTPTIRPAGLLKSPLQQAPDATAIAEWWEQQQAKRPAVGASLTRSYKSILFVVLGFAVAGLAIVTSHLVLFWVAAILFGVAVWQRENFIRGSLYVALGAMAAGLGLLVLSTILQLVMNLF